MIGWKRAFTCIVKTAATTLACTCMMLGSARAQAPHEFLDGDRMPYASFDRLPQTDLKVAGAVIHVAFAPGRMTLPQREVLDWVNHSAGVVSAYYGRFPVASLRLLIVPVDGRGVRAGTTWGYAGAAIRLVVGSDSGMDDLRPDWKIVHEMVHLALPNVGEKHDWLSEGLATYIEPIARVQAGDLTAPSIWADMLRGMPKGLPQAGDQGLDRTHSWGRTYWGGALFCLLADIRIRQQTGNRLGLQDAMRGVLAAGGNQNVDWPIERVFDTGDRATGTHVLTQLYASMAEQPVTPDLATLWKDLGVELQSDGSVRLDNTRKLASERLALTHAPAARRIAAH